MRFKQEVDKKQSELINRKGVVLHNDARPNTTLATRLMLKTATLPLTPAHSANSHRDPPPSMALPTLRLRGPNRESAIG
ncbi:hypothetical protein EVAR_10619_1 [Eumeta japonica]|uniref:Uncharacterized protein n=1 Tax=Eumeta variegata TaxID=151549 RepID=A0A4C1U2R9_EUMVA|nr:hypothetical protein EVAR_10619_1 [Eumeta japonica]